MWSISLSSVIPTFTLWNFQRWIQPSFQQFFYVFSLWLFKSAGTIVSVQNGRFGCNPKVCIRIFFSFFAYPNTYSKAMLARTASAYWLSDSNIWKEIFQIIGSRELRFWPCLIYIFRARLTVSEQKIESLSTGSIHTKFKPSTSLILACTFSILLSITSLVVLRRSLLISLYHLQSVMTFLKSPLKSL